MSLTAANAVIMLSQATLFPVPQQIQEFAADDVTDIDPARILESMMGVDGVLSFGYVHTDRRQSITLQATSKSNRFFDTIAQQQQAAQDVYPLNGIIVLPAVKLKFIMTNGGLETYKVMPAVKKVLQARTYNIVWNRVDVAPA